MSATFNQQN